jgi:hypothetical protein
MLGLALVFLAACSGGGGGGGGTIPAQQGDYVVLAWNDLGMHCLNPTYDQLVILPPYNTLWVQVIRRAGSPEIVTSGVTVEYRILDNTSSHDKAHYGQFWTYSEKLFGVALPVDVGLKGATLTGELEVVSDHFEIVGVPVVPVNDGTTARNPYQIAEITLRDATSGAVLVTTEATVPTSDEISCDACHPIGAAPGTLASAFGNILALHDEDQGTALAAQVAGGTPVLCASCHPSPALGIMAGPAPYLSRVIHAFHATISPDDLPSGKTAAACYDCHPGPSTQCSRSLAHTAADGNCTDCHGTLADVGNGIAPPPLGVGRIPWVQEPACEKCHGAVPEVATGAILYRNAKAHHGVYCAGCHGSPHAMIPSRVSSDEHQAIQYQGVALPLGDCQVCHETSQGGGSASDFLEEHGPSACNVCHTAVPQGSSSGWPHRFGWGT